MWPRRDARHRGKPLLPVGRCAGLQDVMIFYTLGGYAMSHLSDHKDELLKRTQRIAGQVQAIQRSLETEADCESILHLVAATRGALNGLLDEILEAHAREHVAHPDLTPDARSKGLEALVSAIRRYSK